MKLVATLLFASAVAACSAHGSTAPPAPGSDLSSVAGFCEARSIAECNATVVKRCGAPTATACSESRKAACVAEVPQGTAYLAARAPACITAARDAYDDGVLSVAEVKAISDACGPALFSGPGAARSPCTVAYDCSSADQLTCVTPLGATTGKCLAPKLVAPGAPCPGEADQCPAGSYCDPKAMACTPLAVEGESCTPTLHPCAVGLWCPGGPFGSGCTVKGAKGEACNSDADCGNAMCDKALGQAAGTCTEQISLTSFDDACATFK